MMVDTPPRGPRSAKTSALWAIAGDECVDDDAGSLLQSGRMALPALKTKVVCALWGGNIVPPGSVNDGATERCESLGP